MNEHFASAWSANRVARVMRWAGVALGCALSLLAFDPSSEAHHDEAIYLRYCRFAGTEGILAWPQLVRTYTAEMQRGDPVVLPPTRVVYPLTGAILHLLTEADEHRALAWVSLAAAMLTMVVAACLAQMMLAPGEGVAAVWLLACAPLRLALGSRAMIDGFFGLLALVTFGAAWLALIHPRSGRAAAAFGAALAALILTKENSAFVWLGILVAMAVGPRLGLPRPSAAMWRAVILGPLAAVLILALLAGGWGMLVEAMGSFVVKARRNPFTVLACDGPWYRIMLDLFILHPLVVLLAFAGLFSLGRNQPGLVFLGVTLIIGLAALSAIKYGASLRYTTAAEFPLRALACFALFRWTSSTGKYARPLLVGAVLLIGILDLRQYNLFFREKQIYEPTLVEMMRATRVLKSPDDVRWELGNRQ